jgi:hypothetical protein
MTITNDDESTLLYLVHSKGHIGKHGEAIPSVEKALRLLSEDGTQLWRGLYEQEVKAITELLQFGSNVRFTLDHYTSLTEYRCVAERFGRQVKALLHVKCVRGFPLCKWAIDLHKKMKQLNPQEYEESDGDTLIETYEAEAEWILGIGTSLRIVNTRVEDGWTIFEAVRG